MQTLLLSLHLGDDFGHNNLATNVLFRGKKLLALGITDNLDMFL